MKLNPYLVPMVVFGAVLLIAGIVLVFWGYNVTSSSAGSATALTSLTQGSFAMSIGVPLASGGASLLLIAWIIAAAKWQRPEEHG